MEWNFQGLQEEIPGNGVSFMIIGQRLDLVVLYAKSEMRRPYLQNHSSNIGIILGLYHEILGFLVLGCQTSRFLLRLELLFAWGTNILRHGLRRCLL